MRFIKIDIHYAAILERFSCICSCKSWTPGTPTPITYCCMARNKEYTSCSRCWQN